MGLVKYAIEIDEFITLFTCHFHHVASTSDSLLLPILPVQLSLSF